MYLLDGEGSIYFQENTMGTESSNSVGTCTSCGTVTSHEMGGEILDTREHQMEGASRRCLNRSGLDHDMSRSIKKFSNISENFFM